MQCPQRPNPFTDAGSILLREGNARMLDTLSCQPEEILVMCTEDSAERRGPLEVVEIAMSQKTQISDGNGIDPRKTELARYFCRDVLIEVKPKLAHRVETRPWASRR
jgi:hypothetical protein